MRAGHYRCVGFSGWEKAQTYLERAREIFFTLGAVHEPRLAEQLLDEVTSPVVPEFGGA